MKYLAVKNFDRFQHYKDRRPPWIKFYGAILDDYDFIQLSDATRSHLMLLWQVAATHQNRIPFDAKYIAQSIRSRGRVDLQALIDAGFLTVEEDALANTEHDASAPLADRKQDARPPRVRSRARGEAEGETETEQAFSPPRETNVLVNGGDIADRLLSDVDRDALRRLLAGIDPLSRPSWLGEMRAALDAMPGHRPVTPSQLGEALRDYIANGASANPVLRQFRRYLEIASTPKPISVPRLNGGVGARTAAKARAAVEDL